MEHIVIIGNGISGITAARHIRKRSDNRITVISAESDFFFSRTALMYVYMGHMKWEHLKPYEDWFWEKNRIELKNAWVENIDFDKKELNFSEGDSMTYDKLVLATGSVYNKFGWEGEDLEGVQGLVSKQDLELLEKNTKFTKKAVIVGGGLIGVELAEMLRTRKIEVTFLVREQAFWHNVLPLPEGEMISDHIKAHGIDLRHNVELDKILSDGNGRVRAVTTSEGEEIECQLVGLCTGVRPNIEFLRDTPLETDKGILVNEYLETNIPDVYAIGDCVQHRQISGGRKAVEQVWYTGRIMGETLAQTLTGNPTKYTPGNWFNSAKFFDIEYQTYGWVLPKSTANESHFYWQHRKELKAITIAYNKDSGEFIGINTFGIRMRHEVLDKWLTEKKSIEFVLANLKQANFDPEFYDHHEKEIFRSFKNNLQEA
ncbi:NAD(P)/FAD-dependent oxidoreductase [Christiangramia crocea]|uniref:NAD(P)/FAD-dependent oxidoreductase n=1 Tax=Christiangramia crocea TaxID=2904124 RepID=A0A9X2A4A0_9FLAO|nr:NAD(P)/FAD-dependent oxidoreductase [Gramella crocea]MCG9970484.1 NAD(P)/FAD-dependent oxidoreductase [Gramella crocea]